MAKPRRAAMAVRRRGPLSRLLIGAAVFSVVLLGWGGWRGLSALLHSEFMTLSTLEIEGCRVVDAELLRESLEPLLGRPLHRVDPDSVAAAVAAWPRVASARVSRRLPGTLRCRIEEERPVALLLDGGFLEVDAKGRVLPRDLGEAPDLPIIRPGAGLATDSLIPLAIAALAALAESGFDLASEVSEISVGPEGIVYTRNASETRVVLGWEDFAARTRCYAQVFADIAREGFPAELDARYRDQVVAR